MHTIEFRTNNWKAAAQATGALGGIALGWATSGSPIGGLVGGILGLAIATLIAEAIDNRIQYNAGKKSLPIQ